MEDLKLLDYYFFPDFNLLNYSIALTVPYEKSKILSFGPSVRKSIAVFPPRSRFPVTLICCVAFVSASRACSLVKSIAIIL